MTAQMKSSVHILIMLLGLLLIVGGIDAGKTGAVGIGIIISGVNAQAWLKQRKAL
jgi:hypothetical protein